MNTHGQKSFGFVIFCCCCARTALPARTFNKYWPTTKVLLFFFEYFYFLVLTCLGQYPDTPHNSANTNLREILNIGIIRCIYSVYLHIFNIFFFLGFGFVIFLFLLLFSYRTSSTYLTNTEPQLKYYLFFSILLFSGPHMSRPAPRYSS